MKRYRSIIFRMKQRKNEEWKPEINIYSWDTLCFQALTIQVINLSSIAWVPRWKWPFAAEYFYTAILQDNCTLFSNLLLFACVQKNTLYSASPTEAVLTRYVSVRSIPETNRNQPGTNFKVFRRVRTAARISCRFRHVRLSVCPQISAWLLLDEYPWNLILGTWENLLKKLKLNLK